ncbi:MAG: NAD-dependent succinate-semialdehyde dehydrogenase [Acidimicrobiales bacterium]|nr:NAD-dependent succinate-semialdehyde dehydrogenase [Acidimicrobiales bacterium]MDP6241493.1 NAD-dependent succinate-semialdehyde dehydrogenase [Acidimicrobiales bacterium]MDP6760411.1 NAD-dependent succinate-semialdehyde dehydrogenase [Acidimicrobiales bacterium]MDP7124726.1 NAD-dependent succinate-semialdehyde dehydrogenase [Acidimicrobiales bacterium]MDP7353268.1 NAD-dependent succinate-semialdehyde dehydrogenase [Acidimicrobiales bacterium]
MELQDPTLLRTRAYVGGEWIDADSGATFDVTDPATGDVVATVADLGVDETRRAVDLADEAQKAWAARTAKDRGAVLRRWYELFLEHKEDLALIMTCEMGKPIGESRGEVVYAANFIDWFAEEGKRAYGEVIPTHDPTKRLLVLKQPIGVVSAITPWNFPQAMITRKVAPALAAGCASLVRPASETPLSALAAAELADRAGLPPGVLNVIPATDSPAVGRELTTNPTIRKISFTGSTPIGKLLLGQAAGTVKKASMELGGNAPFIVFDDADVDSAVEGAIVSKYRNSGQTCVCANRFLVQEGVYDEFAKKFAEAVADLKVGPGIDESSEIGPLVNEDAIDKVEELVQGALAEGAGVLTGGRRHALGRTYYEVTVLTDVTPDMAIHGEEIFGPVAPLFRFSTEDEAVAMANDTEYGLAAYFYAADMGRTWRVSEGLEYGMVGVNTGLISTEVAPFGGFKESGIGREGSHHGLDEYLETKYVAIGGI